MSRLPVSMSRRSRVTHMAGSATSGRLAEIAAVVLAAVFLAAVALLSLPALRTEAAVLGVAPLWLLAMPLASLSALFIAHRTDRPASRDCLSDASSAVRRRQPDTGLQSRRRPATAHRAGHARAA